jgi:hypothetical protein
MSLTGGWPKKKDFTMEDLIKPNKPALTGFWPTLIAWAAMLLFAFHNCTHMVGAGDTWVALACGRHFINHGVNTVEPFSANSHRPGPTPEEVKKWPAWAQKLTNIVGLDTVKFWHPTGWVNQNWLTHTIFYWLAYYSPIADSSNWCFNSLVYWKFTIYILAVICIYYTGRVLGVHPALSAFSACAAMFIGRSFIDIRPAGFSNLLVAVFILILVLSTYRNYLYIWLIVPLTIFWANVHGGYIYVFIMLVPVVFLRLFILLSKRWTVSIYSILTWLALYVLVLKDTARDPFSYPGIAPSPDKILFWLFVFIIASLVLAAMRNINAPAFYGYHVFVSLIVFVYLMACLFPKETLMMQTTDIAEYVSQCQLSFVVAFVAAAALGIIVTFFKDRLIATSPVAVYHIALAGFAAFVCSIVFNPFHLTNLTHTFQISISQNAEGWRNVHEWWPAFRWDNPVGQAMPFMIMLISGSGLIALYLAVRLMYPKISKGNEGEEAGRVASSKVLKRPRQEDNSEVKRFEMLSKILCLAGMVLVMWVVLLSFSFVEANLAGFLLSGLFGGVLWAAIFVNVHCIYIIIPFSIFAVYSGEPPTYFGRYIFPFITVPFYALMFLVTAQFPKKPKFSAVNIFYVLAAAAAALILMVILVNPFKFKEPVWHLGQFLDLQRIWSPNYEKNLEITYKGLFSVIYIINLLSVVAWVSYDIIRAILADSFDRKPAGEVRQQDGRLFVLPKIDLTLIIIAALTSYMAFRSRRFIPIAGYVTCPVIAMLIDQFIRTAASSWNFYRRGRLAEPDMPGVTRKLIIAASAATVIGLCGFWGQKFYRIYMAPWPFDPDLRSMFIRMTASHAKPFAAMQFIDANKMSGNMLNYWTEGGFIAWGQQPDPNTGKTPLQLFMDGRAQAAYNYDAYMTWSEIMYGGDVVRKAQVRGQNLTEADFFQIGKWINEEMKKRNVWVVLMPSGETDKPFVKGLEYNADWRLVYLDDKQKLYVDITTPRGREIFDGILTGQTKYPYPATRNLMIANNMALFRRDTQGIAAGTECAIKAMEERPSRIAINLLQIYYDSFPQTRPRIDEFWKKYLDDFLANEKRYVHSDNFHYRTMGALVAINHLIPIAQSQKNEELVRLYASKSQELPRILNKVNDMRW